MHCRLKTVTNIIGFHRGLKTKVAEKDVFGTLSERGRQKLTVHVTEKYFPEDLDGYDKEEFDLEPRKNAYFYKYEISKYARQGSIGIKKALELFNTMKYKDRLTPGVQNFSPLIYGCARAGYTKKAFELYEESLKYSDKPTKSTVTCLINACAESPFPEYGLKRLDWFRKHLQIDHNYKLNRIQYHAAIKAYGKLGQLEEASKLISEMIEEGIIPDVQTFDMLLIGCASDKKAGCTLALRVYKRLKMYNLRPDINTYRLLLRCIRDCGVGTRLTFKQALIELPAITSFDQRLRYKKADNRTALKDRSKNFDWLPLITNIGESISSAVKSSPEGPKLNTAKLLKVHSSDRPKSEDKFITLSLTSNQENSSLICGVTERPNLLSDDHLKLIYQIEAIDIDKLKGPADRLILFGGIRGLLSRMIEDDCKPDNKTFSLLLECIRHVESEQLEYFELAKKYPIERDLLFYDLLIRHVCTNFRDQRRLDRAFRFVEEMHKDNIRPNISTFESMALGCESLGQAKRFISDVEQCRFAISDVMIKNLFDCALFKSDFSYLFGLIRICKKRKFQPNRLLVDALEAKRLYAYEIILKYEKGRLENVPDWLTEDQIRDYDSFKRELGTWLKSVELVQEEHPWRQFNVEFTYKKRGFSEFVQKFKAIERVKREAIERGGKFGNLMAEVERIDPKAVNWCAQSPPPNGGTPVGNTAARASQITMNC